MCYNGGMKQKICAFLIAVTMLTGFTSLVASTDTYAVTKEQCNSSSLLGLRPWYAGLMDVKGGKCEVADMNSAQLPGKIWTIVLNILADLFVLLGYVSIGLAIYGGFTWMMSKGEPAQVAKGVKTLKYAVMGTVIAALAWVITNTIVSVLTSTFS